MIQRTAFFAILFLITFSYANAAIVQQTVNDGDINQAGTYIAQTLGNGLSGNVGSIILRQSDSGDYFGAAMRLVAYSDSGYTTQVDYCELDIDTSVPQGADTDRLFDFSVPCDTGTLDKELNPAYYYAIINTNYNYPFQSWRGASSNIYANGEVCIPTSITGALANCLGDSPIGSGWYDMYFIIDSGFVDTRTRIVEITPANGANIAASSTVGDRQGATTTLSVEWFINEEDIGFISGVQVQIDNVDQNWLYGARSYSPYSFTDIIIPVAGTGLTEYEIWLPYGGYKISAKINTTYLGGIVNGPISALQNTFTASQDESNPLSQYHLYTIGGNTTISGLQQNINNQLEGILSATGTGATLADCNILSGFDFGNCMAFSFIPSQEQLNSFGNVISQNIFSKFPLGYVWSVVTIIASDNTAVLPVLDAKVPNGIPGAGAEFEIALTPGMLDYVLMATTSQFTNESAPNTGSLYSITYPYWQILIYLGVFLYLLQRILGSHLIGRIGDIMGMDVGVAGVDYKDPAAHGKVRTAVNGKTYQEYTDSDIKRMIEKGRRPNSAVSAMGKNKKR